MNSPLWFPSPEPVQSRDVAVIGAGIAGASAARSLAERGFTVQVLERHALPAQGASGNPAGIVLPVVSRTGNALSELTRIGLDFARRRMQSLMQQDARVDWQPSGVLRLARNERHAAQQEKIAAQQAFAPDFARWVDAAEGSALVGVTVEQPGWWFAGGGSVCPPKLVNALLQHSRISLRCACAVRNMRREAGEWWLEDAQGVVLAHATNVVLANAHEALQLLPALYAESLPLAAIRGQVSLCALGADLTTLRAVACREGYAIPPREAQICFGASFTHHAQDAALSVAEHQGNLERLQAIFPHAALPPIDALKGRVSFRCATPDRLPMLGALHDAEDFRMRFANLHHDGRAQREQAAQLLPGLWLNVGHGARGLVWADMLGEALACMMSGEDSPLPQALLHALHPARFDYRLMRTAPAHRKAWTFSQEE
ncbi:MAG: FAD-dependent 5-carboxymethylaminomethyl-2-thiouridine(34) oxidoreductase MnmC [Pseudomonadota bacterium]